MRRRGEDNAERGARAWGAFQLDVAAVELGQGADDAEADAGTLGQGFTARKTKEAFPDARLELDRNTWTLIGHLDAHLTRTVGAGADNDRTGGCVAEGIYEQIADHLLQAARINQRADRLRHFH